MNHEGSKLWKIENMDVCLEHAGIGLTKLYKILKNISERLQKKMEPSYGGTNGTIRTKFKMMEEVESGRPHTVAC